MDFDSFSKTVSYGHFDNLDHSIPVWIFGAGGFARALGEVLLAEGFQVYGFVVSESKEGTLLDLPVVTWKDITWENVQLAMGVFSHMTSYTKILTEAHDAGFAKVFMPWELYAQFEKQLGWRYWLTPLNYITGNLEKIQSAAQILADQESVDCLLNVLLFRTGNLPEYADYRSQDQHYFNQLSLKPFSKRSINIVDGGAYTGDSYQEAIAAIKIDTAHLFEPDPKNFARLTLTVGDNAICYPLALSDSEKTITFASGVGPSSAATDHGDIKIEASSLDQIFPKQHIDFVKLDIEGSEADALRGGVNLLKRCRPVISMALYHRPGDMWELPLLVNQLVQDYSFYIRQHDNNSFEAVFYAVPN
jgi:FkbM family methyltransferase